MPRLGLISSLTGGAPSSEAPFTNTYSLDFDGTDDFVNIPQGGTAFPSGDAPRTVSLWIKRVSGGNATSGGEGIFIWFGVFCWLS